MSNPKEKVDQQVNFEKSVLQTSLFYWFLCFIPAFKSGCQHCYTKKVLKRTGFKTFCQYGVVEIKFFATKQPADRFTHVLSEKCCHYSCHPRRIGNIVRLRHSRRYFPQRQHAPAVSTDFLQFERFC